MKTIHFISLGCPKNRVDSEVMLGVAASEGYSQCANPADAEVIVVNTCGFIDPAKKESIDTILAMADLKSEGRCQQLIVAGCLSQRHPEEMAAELPEVDHFLGSSDMLRIRDVLRGRATRMMVGNPADWVVRAADPRVVSSTPGSAYVKIAEGCNRRCSFCVIPTLRGKQRSRPISDVVREVEQLAHNGVKEINLISQDTIAYGRDAGDTRLAQLVEAVAEVSGVRWVRLFYLYPEKLDDALVALLADHPRVLPYVDMPLQHASDAMLRSMRRGHGGQRLRDLVTRLRARITGLTFRSAFIVGHPGETQDDFDELCDFVAWAELERVGVFRYSDEEGCHANSLDLKVDEVVAGERYHRLMSLGRDIARRKNQALIGQELEVLVEGESDQHEHVQMARHAGQAPEIDGAVYLSGTEQLATPIKAGTMLKVRISQASDYDLVGEAISPVDPPSQRTEPPRTGPTRTAPTRIQLRVLPADGRLLQDQSSS